MGIVGYRYSIILFGFADHKVLIRINVQGCPSYVHQILEKRIIKHGTELGYGIFDQIHAGDIAKL